MAKFIEDRSSLKKKKKKENAQKAAPSSANKKQVSNIANQVVNRTANAAKRTTSTVGNSAQRQNTVRRNVQDSISRNAPQRYNNRPSGAAQPSTNRTVQDRLAASRQRREQAEADIKRRRQETEARSQRISQSRNPRMQDTARGTKLPTLEERRQKQDRLRQAQEQKMGNNSMASKEAQRTANRALKNTPTVAKESAKQVGIGHGKTFADITEANKSAAIGSKIDIKSKEFQEDIEKRRKESTRVAKSSFKTLSDMQEKSESKMEKVTKDAKGLEKAYYGALESGVGMATDRLAGPAWAVSMLSRTYGNTRGQAQKEGATEDEDRAYSLLQAAKEVATEYMFQGVGLAKGLSGRHSLSLGEMAANALTKNMRGPLANATHAGIRLLGGVGEENLEEVAGWGLDPFIKEFTYGRNVRTRQAQQMMRDQSDALRSNITSMDDARAIAAYLGSDDFLDSQIRTYMDSGIGKEEARDLAENMRDYLDASLSGDTEKMADIEESLSKKLSGRGVKDILKQDLSLSELKDTIASTTLLTATTGLPGTVTTTARGAAIKEQLGSDGIRALAKTAEDFEDGEMQLKAKAMSDRLDAGKDITNTQAYDLAVGVQEQYNKDADRQQTAYQTAQKTIKSERLVTPYRVSRDGDIQMDEVTDKTYQSTAKSAKSAIETFIENSDGKESLTDTEIDRGSRAIAGFKTGVFTVDDANELNFRNTAVRSAFEKETGIDLSEYVVKGKDGQIDIPATNTATKNALFAQAADNLVATAQAETANWVDNTKGEVVTQISRRMGASGTAALQTALDDVDERDRSSYMMTANASDVLYQSARNMGTEWENAKDYAKRMFPNVAEDKLKAMYEAGLADRDMATDEARGQQIKIGEKVELKKQSDVPTGQVIIETSAPVKGSVIRTFTELARNLGVDIHLVDHFTDKDGKVLKNVNGEYIDGNIFINVNSDFEKNMGFIFMHEVTHHLKMYAPEQYKALENLVREKWFKYDSAQMQSEIAKKIETYAKHGQTLTEEQALEEIIADAAHEFLTDRNFAREIANEDASLAQAVLTSIRNALRMLRRIMSADNLDETHMNTLFSQLDILDEAERLWLDAYKQAVRNNAAVAVDRLQNQIYEEGRQAVSDEQTDGYTIKDGNARWTDERIGSLIREYGASNPDYSQAYAVLMNPRDFLKLTLRDKFLDMWNEGANQEEHPEVYSLNEEELRDERQTPFLSIHSNKGSTHVVARVDGHEGRHRMRALMEAGVTSVPVVIQDMDTKYSKKSESWMLLGSQNFGDGPINDKATVDLSDLVPIKESNRDELIQKFGGDAQVRFSISEPVERVKDLIAVHNLKADDIRNTFELGGFPMPSIAVTKDSMGHDMYGDITLMFHSNTIDPQFNRNNQVFGGDAWTPTFPTIRYKHNEKVTDRIRDLYYDNANRIGYDAMRPLYDVAITPEDAINRYGGEQGIKEHFMKDTSLMRTFLKINNKDVEDVVTRTETTLSDTEQKLRQHMIDSLGEDAIHEWEGKDVPNGSEKGIHRRQWVENHLDEIKDAYKSFMRSGTFHFSEEEVDNVISNMKLIEFVKLMRNAANFLNDGATTVKEEVDRKATDKLVKEAAEKNGYETWVNNLLDGIEEKQGIRNDKDAFTRQGNRRSWESLHEPVTLENVVKVMRSELAAGGNGIVGANPRGAAQKNYKNLDEIRSDEDRLQQLPEEEFKELEGSATQKLVDVCQDIVNSNPKRFDNKFGATLDVGEYVAEILNETRDKSSIHKRLQKDYTLKVTDEQMDALMGAIDEIANLPTGYFEAKPRRAVGFDEVKAAIIPASTDEDIKQGFNDRGIQMYEYDPDVEGNRTEKVNQAASENDLRFSISEDLDEPYMAAVNAGNMEEAQKYVDEAAKRAFPNSKLIQDGEFFAMWHHTNAEFNSFLPGTSASSGRLRGIYFTPQEHSNMSNLGTKHGKYYLNVENPKFAFSVEADKKYVNQLREMQEGVTDREELERINRQFKEDTGVDAFYDWQNGWYNVMTPEQVKSADTVTYAEDGSVVPLSERFDPTNNDIRYSMSTEDADGNVLTTNQMEYFKNSQARDENGRLVPVYHTTNNGGFTIFDPSYSDDRRSLFFASNWNVSQTYGHRANKPIDIDNAYFTSWAEFEKYAKSAFVNDPEWDSTKSVAENTYAAVIPTNGGEDISFEKWMEDGDRIEADNPYASYEYHGVIQFPTQDAGWIQLEAGTPYDLLQKISRTLGREDSQKGYYSCYLNLENPLVLDAQGDYWNSISYSPVSRESVLEAMKQSAEIGISRIDTRSTLGEDGLPTDERTVTISGERKGSNGEWTPFEVSKTFTPDDEGHVKEIVREFFRESVKDSDNMIRFLNRQWQTLSYSTGKGLFLYDYAVSHINDNLDFGFEYFDEEGKTVYPASQYQESSYTTRQLAELAETEGHDGVIIRNCRDIGGASSLKGSSDLSDIFIAFSSNQVKDTRNENPTKNPDIRYSITEDEGKSKKDYEHVTDMSYEELQMYEDMIANASESYDIESAFGKAFDGEKVSKFYSALTEEVGMVFDDEILEEGRMRMAKSKADFWSNLNTKWQERWETKGEVLDTKSVKTNVRNLIRGVMNNSNTDRQYKTDLLNKTLMDMRVAYQLMKQDRTDIASALLYHSALRMITDVDFIQDDTEYQEYKGIRDYLRGEPITVGEDYWQGKAFQQFRKEHFGILKLRKGANGNIGEVYAQLENLYPHIFSETERSKNGFKDDEEDLLQYIGFVTEQNMQPFMEAYSSEYCADWAFEIADDLYEIMENGEGVTSLADRYKAKYDAKAKAMKTRHAEAILRVRKQKQAAIDALKDRYNERLDRQKELARDAIRREREKFRQQKQDEKERTKERRLHSKYFDSIVKSHKTLSDRLLTNTKDKHIPEQYKKDLAELLAAFDLQTVASKKLEIRNGLYYRQNYQSQKTIRMKALQETLLNIQADSQLFYVNDSITEIIDRLLGKNAEGKTDPLKSVEGRTIDELTSSELKDIDKLLKALIHEFNNYESVRTGAKRQQAADIATAQIDSCLEHAGKFGEGLDYQNFLGALDNILNLDEVTPAYMFRQIDPQNNGIGMMFKELRRSFGKYVRNQNQLNEWMEEIIGEYNNKGRAWKKYGSALEEWRISTRAKEFQLTNGNVKLTPAQMMSIYCLSHRQQAYDHMTGAGIVVQPVSFQAKMASDLRKRANYALPVILTDSDIKLITSKLTPDQIKVADKLQELMATKMAEWGNEASMSVMGIRLFEDPDYFPIKSDKAALEKDFSAEQFMDCIRNFGFTKAVQPGARNAIAIGDIFDVVAEHCNNMNLYNAYSESMNDFMKVYNYHAMREDGSDYLVEQAIAHAYSKKATTFIRSFMKDLNGNVSRERTTGIEQMMNDSLGKAKKASVFANGRVALQQPTALMRAFAVINPKYLKGVKAGKATMQEMFEHSPIALWKSWGYYDINMGKSIEDLMMNNGSWAEDKMSDIYGELDNRTWAVIWTMCKNEIEDKHKDVEKGSDEYWELVSERFDEVVDLTQVVDSPFHRSHAMRSKNTLTKMATAFMAEPTLTYNMVRDGFRRAKEELRLGNKKAAGKIVGRTVAVFALSAWATAAAAAIWDAVRGKAPGGDDDDDEQGFFDMWFDNMLENLKDNINLLNNIYYIKDVFSLLQGWDQRNLGLQGWKHLADGFRQLKGEKVYSKLSWYENWLAGVGYLTGKPYKTMMSDGKAIFKMFGLSAPGFITDQLDKLDSIGSSTKDMNRGASSSSGISDPKTSSKSTAVNLWTYDNAPFRIEDGSAADNFLNHFGINLTSAEIAAAEEKKIKAEREKKVEDIKAKTAGMSGVEKDKKVWSYISSQIKKEHGDMPVSSIVEAGDYSSIYEYREMYVAAGGNTDYFDERIFDASKKAMKKSIVYNPTDAQIEAQDNIRNYLTDHGMSESELSEIAYKSYTAKELKVAFRLNDEDAIVEELTPLVRAGLSLEDFHRIYDNRNRIDLKKYKESGGKYAEKLKSMGDYNWPCNGTITSTFGHRSSPGGIGSTNHQGIDIGASMGAPVTAADGGVVVRSGWYGGYGKTVQIQHDDGTITQYSHLSWWEPKVGDVVAQGQEIGKVGSTGNSTGPHLHFGVMKNGEYVDPMDYLNKKS